MANNEKKIMAAAKAEISILLSTYDISKYVIPIPDNKIRQVPTSSAELAGQYARLIALVKEYKPSEASELEKLAEEMTAFVKIIEDSRQKASSAAEQYKTIYDELISFVAENYCIAVYMLPDEAGHKDKSFDDDKTDKTPNKNVCRVMLDFGWRKSRGCRETIEQLLIFVRRYKQQIANVKSAYACLCQKFTEMETKVDKVMAYSEFGFDQYVMAEDLTEFTLPSLRDDVYIAGRISILEDRLAGLLDQKDKNLQHPLK